MVLGPKNTKVAKGLGSESSGYPLCVGVLSKLCLLPRFIIFIVFQATFMLVFSTVINVFVVTVMENMGLSPRRTVTVDVLEIPVRYVDLDGQTTFIVPV